MALSKEAEKFAYYMLQKKNVWSIDKAYYSFVYPASIAMMVDAFTSQDLKDSKPVNIFREIIDRVLFKYVKQQVEDCADIYIETCQIFNEVMDESYIEEIVKAFDSQDQARIDSSNSTTENSSVKNPLDKIYASTKYKDIIYQARLKLKVAMKRIEMERKKEENARISVGDNFTGALQVGGSQNTQTVHIQINTQFDNAFNKVLELIQKDTHLDEFQKEDAIDALQKLPDLAKKEPSESVMKRAKEKLDVVNAAISTSKDLALIAAPYLIELARFFTPTN